MNRAITDAATSLALWTETLREGDGGPRLPESEAHPAHPIPPKRGDLQQVVEPFGGLLIWQSEVMLLLTSPVLDIENVLGGLQLLHVN